MNITLSQLIPTPLKEKVLQRPSDVWNNQTHFTQGQWVKIKAPSGTGKTTLMHIICKLRFDYTGTVSYDAAALNTIKASTLSYYRQQKISCIFQDMRLFANLTAKENIELKRVMHQPVLYDAAAMAAMAEQLGIAHILPQKANTCSYGEQQRIAIIRSLMQPFEWLIMDEPFSHLDAANTSIAANLIATECKKRGAGFILTDLDDDHHFDYSHHLLL